MLGVGWGGVEDVKIQSLYKPIAFVFVIKKRGEKKNTKLQKVPKIPSPSKVQQTRKAKYALNRK